MADERVSLVLEDGSDAGLTLRGFESYRIRNDVRQMGASFDGKLAPIDDPDLVIALKRHPKIRLEVDGTPTFRGWVVGVQGGADRSGSWANISCQDFLGYACKWDLPRGFTAFKLSIREAFAAALARYMPAETQYIGSNDANRQAIGTRSVEQPIIFHGRRWNPSEPGGGWNGYDEYAAERDRRAALGLPPPSTAGEWVDYDYFLVERNAAGQYVIVHKDVTLTDRDDRELVPHVGQTVGGFLRDICEHHRLLCWQAGNGDIVITRPRYDQNALVTLARGEVAVEGTIESGGWTVNPGDQPVEMDTVGHAVRVAHETPAKLIVNVKDAGLWTDGWRGYRVVVDENLRDLAAAQERSRRALHDAQLPTCEYHCRISGHGYGTYLFAVDTLMHVRDPKWNTDQDLYCVARDWSKGRSEGTATDLVLIPPGLLLSE